MLFIRPTTKQEPMKLIGFFSLLLAPLNIYGKINSNLEFESNFTVIMMSGHYKDTSTVVQLSADLNKLLTESRIQLRSAIPD